MSLTGNSTLSNYVPFPFLSAIFRHRCYSLWRAGASLTSSLHTFLAKNEMIAFHLLKESVSRDLRPLILLFKRIYLGITCIVYAKAVRDYFPFCEVICLQSLKFTRIL